MADTTAMSRLPLQLWDRIFDHVIPNREVTLQEWRASRLPSSLRYTWTQHAPALRCAEGEDPAHNMTVRALADTPNLLFRGSRHKYWSTLVREAVWCMEWDPDRIRDPARDLDRLVQYFGSSVRHVVLRMDGMFPFWPDHDELEERATGTTELAWDVITKFRELRSFNRRIEVEGGLYAEEGDWLECEMFPFPIQKVMGTAV